MANSKDDAGQDPELMVITVERLHLTSSEIVVQARRSFDFVVDDLSHPIPNCAQKISIDAGAIFHLTASRALGQVGRQIRFAEVHGNPAFSHLWTLTESARKRRWWQWLPWA